MDPKKKQHIYRILDGDEEGSPVLDRSSLARLATLEKTQLTGSWRTWCLEFPVIVASCCFSLIYLYPLETVELYLWTGFSTAAFVFLFWLEARRKVALKKALEPVMAGFEELERLRDHIREYVASMNSRTGRYFHCVTSSKVSSFFILSQMHEALNSKMEEAKPFAHRQNADNCNKLFDILQGSIMFSDGAVPGTGNTHVVPLARLNGVVGQLIQYLEAALEELEEEIGILKKEAALGGIEPEVQESSPADDQSTEAPGQGEDEHPS